MLNFFGNCVVMSFNRIIILDCFFLGDWSESSQEFPVPQGGLPGAV